MPHFQFVFSDDDRISAMYKDGVLIPDRVRLEMPNGIARTYFSGAFRNLQAMVPGQEQAESRLHGLQCFLLSLVGLEAFVNVYFHQVALERNDQKMIAILSDKKAHVERKLTSLPPLAFGTALPDQKAINRKVRELYALRSQIVHPTFEPSSLTIGNWMSSGMVENFQQAFEDRQFVLESLQWCLLVIARVGLAAGDNLRDKFLVFWTTFADKHEDLSAALGVSPMPGELKKSLRNHSASSP